MSKAVLMRARTALYNRNLAGDVETSERATFDEVTRIVGFA